VEYLSVPSSHFLDVFYPEIFIPLRQILFLETARSHSESNHGNRMGVSFHN
jgi:hypothetical protein